MDGKRLVAEGGYAFPRTQFTEDLGGREAWDGHEGMTYRRWLIGQALGGIMASEHLHKIARASVQSSHQPAFDGWRALGEMAVMAADGALAAIKADDEPPDG